MEISVPNYLLVEVTDISNNQKSEISKDIQNAAKIKAETYWNKEIKSEIFETDYYNSKTGNDEETLGNFESIEIRVKNEIIDEELIIKEDLNLCENEILKNPEFYSIKIEKKEDEYIPSNDSNQIDSKSTHSNTNPADGKIIINDDKPSYKCDVCQKTFTLPSIMMRHYRTHTDDRPYTCKICRKSFRQSSTMRKHERLHTGLRPHRCEVCHKSFAQASQLKSHSRVHLNGKPYCSTCHKSFGTMLTLKCHIGCPPNYP